MADETQTLQHWKANTGVEAMQGTQAEHEKEADSGKCSWLFPEQHQNTDPWHNHSNTHASHTGSLSPLEAALC